MRLSIVRAIYRKEITETLRDWRTLLMMVGLPVILYPLLIIGASRIKEMQTEAMEAHGSVVSVWGDLPEALRKRLTKEGVLACEAWRGVPDELRRDLESGAQSVPWPEPEADKKKMDEATAGAKPAGPAAPPSAPAAEEPPPPPHPVLEAARMAISAREVDAIVAPLRTFKADMEEDRLGRLIIYYDSVRPESRQAADRAQDELLAYREDVRKERERAHGLAEGFTRGLDLASEDVAPPARVSGKLLGTSVAFLLIFMSLLGGLYPSVDLTAGEKERGTMETLLCAPLRSTEIIVGKFLTVWTLSMAAGAANLVSIAITLLRVLPGSALQALTPSPSAFLLIFLLYAPVSFITSACFLAVGVFAKDFKDGQNLITPVYMVFAMPASLVLLPGIELGPWTAFVPVLNISLLIKALLVGEARADFVFLTLLSSVAYGALAVLLAARLFEREQVLLGGRESLRATLGLERRRGALPSPVFSFVVGAVMLVVLFYGSLSLERFGVVAAILGTQYGLILLPTLVCVLGFGFPLRRTLSLRLPTARGLAAAVVLGLSAWAFAAGVLVRLVPPPESFTREMAKLFLDGDSLSLPTLWFVLALSPALCEEALFRGLVLSGLRSLGKWPALLLTAAFFGVFHASLYRLLPTAFLGVLLGYLVWRTGSLLCGIVAHALNNGLLATLSRAATLGGALGVSDGKPLPWHWTALGTAVMVGGLVLLRQVPEPVEERLGAGRET
ncbi:MAG: CPBP family intramembrane metalloprotease [Planctomycetes bacterium]|nr:CPBP family intramembrane metalloprotease [Planctomycetota bacterium]